MNITWLHLQLHELSWKKRQPIFKHLDILVSPHLHILHARYMNRSSWKEFPLSITSYTPGEMKHLWYFLIVSNEMSPPRRSQHRSRPAAPHQHECPSTPGNTSRCRASATVDFKPSSPRKAICPSYQLRVRVTQMMVKKISLMLSRFQCTIPSELLVLFQAFPFAPVSSFQRCGTVFPSQGCCYLPLSVAYLSFLRWKS